MKKLILLLLATSYLLPTTSAQFLDVDVTHPYFHSIADLYQTDVVRGYSVNGDTFFKPRQSINRAEVLKILMLSADLELDGDTAVDFPDVPSGAWFADFVREAAHRGIVKGYADGRFYPEVKVTRAEFLKMLIESFGIPMEPVAEGEWFSPYLETAKAWRLLPAGEDPHAHINRGEVAEVIFRTKAIVVNDFAQKYTYRAEGKASYYNEGFAGRPTANGETYDPYALTAAHRTLPFNTRLKVYNEDGKFVVVRINDRGPYHKDRVIDLSEKAFASLAPISRGVINVGFEVLSDPQDEQPPIPEQIRPNLELETRSPAVPSALYDRLRKQSETEASVPETKTLPTVQSLFDETVPTLPMDFFEAVELRRFIPQKLAAGQVLKFSGRIIDNRRPKTVTVFLKDKATGEQQVFTDQMSGQNFELAVPFYEAGEYHIGLVFDENLRSRVGDVTVVSDIKTRRFPASGDSFASKLEVETQPEKANLVLRWSTDDTRLSQLSFIQGNKTENLIFENGQNDFNLPYDFLRQHFGPNSDLVIRLQQASSTDGSWQKQQSNWKTVTQKSFRLWAGFPDQELVGAISLSNFSRYYRDLDPITLRGQVINDQLRLSEKVYITDPRGDIQTATPAFSSTRSFEFALKPTSFGRYIIEIVSDKGEILFNRAIYFSDTEILPVLEKDYTPVKIHNKAGILHWTNTIRSLTRRPVLVSDPTLAAQAQRYAERMANENFIAHIAPDGENLEDRVGDLDFTSYGENLAYGSTLELALNGLEDSASHYKNIKNSTWKKVGIGMAKNATGDVYVVQIFAK